MSRRARCKYYGNKCSSEAASDRAGLAFFEPRTAGSSYALNYCRCGMAKVAHGAVNASTGRAGITSHPFEARGASDFDAFYCGCYGWD